MEFTQQQSNALDCLYDSGTPAMCAVTHDLQLLWSNRRFEQRLLLLVQAKAAAAGSAILESSIDIPLFDGNEYIYCTIEKMFLSHKEEAMSSAAAAETNGIPDYYLLRFRAEPVLSLAHDAGTEMLICCAGECRTAAEQSLNALNEVYQVIVRNHCSDTGLDAVDRMLASCYRFLNQAVRFEELSWYGDADMHRIGEDEPLELASYTRMLFDSVSRTAGNLLPVTYAAAYETVWVKVNEERLLFALLSMFQTVHKENPPGCRVMVRCGCEDGYAVLSMYAVPDDSSVSGRVHALRYSHLDATPLSNEALMRRFCKQYSAEFSCNADSTGEAYKLRIPLTDQQHIAFESPARRQEEGRYGTVRTMLSAMIDFRHMGSI